MKLSYDPHLVVPAENGTIAPGVLDASLRTNGGHRPQALFAF